MEHINFFLAQAAVIALPGILWAKLDQRYARSGKWSQTDLFVNVFIYGLASYITAYIVYALLGEPFVLVDFVGAQERSIITRQIALEIMATTGLSFVLGLASVAASNYKLLTRLLHTLGITKRYGDEDVWDYTLNSSSASVEYVHWRDFDRRTVYAGWVSTFSETEKLREIVLSDVQVFDFEGALLYETPRMYVARKPEDVHIEFPYKGSMSR